MSLDKLIKRLNASQVTTVGSSVIPSVEHSKDIDVLLLLDGATMEPLVDIMTEHGFVSESEEYDTTEFYSFRKGTTNVLVTYNEVFYRRFLRATDICIAEDIVSRADRIAVHRRVLYGQED